MPDRHFPNYKPGRVFRHGAWEVEILLSGNRWCYVVYLHGKPFSEVGFETSEEAARKAKEFIERASK